MKSLLLEIKQKLTEKGASLVGFANIRDLPAEVTGSMNFAISIAAALDPLIVKEIKNGPTSSYYQEYRRVNQFLTELSEIAAEYLENKGSTAAAIKPTVEGDDLNYDTLTTSLPHKTIARLAGLGWIGKSALLITNEYGSAVRFTTVLTNAEFEVVNHVNDSHCGDCNKCVESCPAKAISGKNWKLGLERQDIYDAFACYHTARKLSKNISLPNTICGICINVCPWTQRYISSKVNFQGK